MHPLPFDRFPPLPGLWVPNCTFPALAAVLTCRRRVASPHLAADGLFPPTLSVLKSIFESLNGSHFGFSKTNTG